MTNTIARRQILFHPEKPIDVTFDAPEISSDAGIILFRLLDEQMGLCEQIADLIPDSRRQASVVHSRHEQVRQRLFQILQGYEDCNDADFMRSDPLMLLACDRLPNGDQALSSTPTLCRFENVVDWRTICRLLDLLEENYVASLPEGIQSLVIDLDGVREETYGQQTLSFYNKHFGSTCFFPLFFFDQDGQLITAILRPGNRHDRCGAKSLLDRLIRRLKQRFPKLKILVRGDAHFAMPSIMTCLEQLNTELGTVDYLFGITSNAVLRRHIATPRHELEQVQASEPDAIWRHFTEFNYAADTWPHERRIVARLQTEADGIKTRFVVTSLLEAKPQVLYEEIYCQRGQAENHNKALKSALKADRMSCESFVANFFRLLLHAFAYRFMFALRKAMASLVGVWAYVQFDTLRLRFLKVAAIVRHSVRRVWIQLSASFPHGELFSRLLGELSTVGARAP